MNEYMNGWEDGVKAAMRDNSENKKLNNSEYSLKYIEGYYAGRNARKKAEMWSQAKQDTTAYLVGI